MRFATAQLAALAYYILSTEATFPLLGDIFDCIPHNTPPVCSELNLYHDTSASINGSQNNKNKRDVEKRTFGNFGFNSGVNAAFVVSGAKKLSDGSYGIDCNFKSDSSVQLNLAFGKKIKQLSVTGTGYSDIDLLGHVANPFEWSASFKIKAEIIKGKCCLPSGFKIITDFESNCPEFDAIKQIFGTSQIIYKVNAISHAIGTFDASALFNAQLNAFPVKRELNEFEELNNNNGITHSKRTLGLLLNLLKKVTGGCDTLQQFCWDCQCDTPSVSTTIVSTSSAPETSTTPESSVPETTIVTTSSAPETTPESSAPETTTTTTPESSAPETTTTTTPESSAPETTPVSSSVDSTSVTSVPESSAPESSAPETETSPIVQLSTTTAQTTTVITVTSCSNNACSKTKVTTGVVVVTSEDTIYTTFCPLTETTPVTSNVDSTAETSAPESSVPETTAESTTPESTAPESTVPETTAESTTPESTAPESTAESTTPESTAPETETSPTVQFSTTTAQTTTVLTVTSCSNNACSESEVTTGVVVITTEDTIYTTFCPLTETTTATESSTPSVETTPIAPESSAPASESVPVTESSSVAPIAETTPVSPVAPNAESTPVAPNAESTPVAETTPIAPTTAPETSAIVSTTEGTIPTTLESISIIQSSANSSYTIAPVSSFEGAGNNMRLTYGAAIVGLAALLI